TSSGRTANTCGCSKPGLMVPMARILVVGVVFIAAPYAFAELKPTRQPISEMRRQKRISCYLPSVCRSGDRVNPLSSSSHEQDYGDALTMAFGIVTQGELCLSNCHPATQCRSKRSPSKVSRKREYFRSRSETFGIFSR